MSQRPLSKRHLRHLLASGISPEVMAARGYRTVRDAEELVGYDFRPRAWKRPFVPGLLIPIHGPRSGVVGYSYRPDTPWFHPEGKGKPTRYVGPDRHPLHVDVHPLMLPALADTSRAAIITEGHKKSDAAASRGLLCLALSGVDCYQYHPRTKRGRKLDSVPCDEWAHIPMQRDFVIVYDSDVATNDKVQGARVRLTNFLRRREANRVFWIDLPAGDGKKVGLDDFFAAGGTVQDLRDLPRNLAFDRGPGRVMAD